MSGVMCSQQSILVVDDEPELRQLLAEAIGQMDLGLDVKTAASGAEAIEHARRRRPTLVVTDLCLGDTYGLEVIDAIRADCGEVPAVVITGRTDADTLTGASRCRPVELMTKPLDLDRLREAITRAMDLTKSDETAKRRHGRLRDLARESNRQRKDIRRQLENTCTDLTDAYRSLSGQLALQQIVLGYQRDLISAQTDDDVFRHLFRLFVKRSGPVFGVALVCDADAELQMVGRFGVPQPDNPRFCRELARPLVETVLKAPKCRVLDLWERAEQFDESIREYLCGVSALVIPLLPAPGEMIGLVTLYRKGEQPFTEDDLALAEMTALATATAVRRND